jgi:Ca2+/Na+ antiporter
MSRNPTGIFLSPSSVDFNARLDALWDFAPCPIVGSNFFNILIPVGCDIIFIAFFAFIYMTISHFWMFIKLF